MTRGLISAFEWSLFMESIIAQIQQTSIVEWLGTAAGLVGVYFSIKEKVIAWPFFLICYGLYAYLSFTASLYAAMILNTCFLPISVYGWWKWGMSSSEDDGSFGILKLSKTQILWMLGIQTLGTLVIGSILSQFTQGVYPYLDAFATSLSFMAQWMLSRKYIENWIAWFIADVVFIYLWGIQGYWVAVGMFLVFTFLAATGYMSWRKDLANSNG